MFTLLSTVDRFLMRSSFVILLFSLFSDIRTILDFIDMKGVGLLEFCQTKLNNKLFPINPFTLLCKKNSQFVSTLQPVGDMLKA